MDFFKRHPNVSKELYPQAFESWFRGQIGLHIIQYFEESLDAYNREEERINNERGLLARIFGGRKKPEPEQWNETHDEMALAFLTP